jgi:DinB superfamily
MRRSKYGYLLLALLVITGLAGTITSTSLTSKERKFAATHLKDTKINVLKSVKGLSPSQLNFKAASDKWSIKECVFHIALTDKNLWRMVDAAMKHPANPEKRTEIKLTDDQLIAMVEDRSKKFITTESLDPKKTTFNTLDDALESFKSSRTEHVKYLKNTTEDLRNHVIQLPIGWIDCYQACLFMSAHSNRHMQQIEEVKATANFPSQ